VRVLGVDPGTIRTGWGVVEPVGARVIHVASGTIECGQKQPLHLRLRTIHRELVAVLEAHRPDEVAVEDVFFSQHPNAALKLGHARGVALVVAANAELPVFTYPASVVKRSVVGRGRAGKGQVAQIVAAILQLRTLPGEDATDALAVALTHVQASRFAGAGPRR